MNRIHHWLCRSAHWQKVVEQRVPWVISSANLGRDVLETGPGPGLTTNLLRSRVQRLTAIEADPGLAESLRSRSSPATPPRCLSPMQRSQGASRSPCCIMCPLALCRTKCFAKYGVSSSREESSSAATVCGAPSCGSFTLETPVFSSIRIPSPRGLRPLVLKFSNWKSLAKRSGSMPGVHRATTCATA
jgi:Ribosomal RNA adenine dimethylase